MDGQCKSIPRLLYMLVDESYLPDLIFGKYKQHGLKPILQLLVDESYLPDLIFGKYKQLKKVPKVNGYMS
jgi:hypothetical protein